MLRRFTSPLTAAATIAAVGLTASAVASTPTASSERRDSLVPVGYATSTVTAQFADATILATQGPVLRGVVSPGGGRKVTLQRYHGSAWHPVTTVQSAADGKYSFSVGPIPRGQYTYRAVVDRTATASAVASAGRALQVAGQTKVSAGLSVTTKVANAGSRAKLQGKVYNTQPLHRPIILQRQSGTSWTSLWKGTTNSTGGYAFTVPEVVGTRTYRVLVPGVFLATQANSAGRAFTVTSGTTTTPKPSGDGSVLPYWGSPSWRDEFTGSAVNSAHWRVHDKTYISYDKASLYAKQCTVANGVLRMRAERTDPRTDMFGRSFASCYLTSQGKFAQRYGRFEVRAKLPTTPKVSAGLWPSFWLRDGKGSGEIDIMESWGTTSTRPAEEKPENYSWTVHADTNSGSSGVRTRVGGDGRPKGAAPITTAYHRYAAEWTPEAVTFFFDNEVVGKVTAAKNPWLVSSFPTSVNMRLHYAVGGAYWGPPNASTKFPADYMVDYVRVWARP